ncbi:arsenate reductase [Acidithiobacillus thiooxidans]|uniref:Arsenate reductase n=2 Tax=Acidithiobacillus thiooxidans TaxID=930 RepID=A0A1C2J387_ACITH|nr:ArsC family reductase [Acidithiobacillus thiooxidans]OCX74346.1 arsenate reductase [Acidithiobacillus thiooxidans]OCX82703.1 arsenate reductase [Acidithiobacillus thiooxidans]OCX88900.1 arsenate reductase [Acidithiobacillus thiooxidans]OFC47984.1 arsenate reductase [Acidithiobacillus thiooxidans]
MTISIYGIRNCDTMKKAFAWLNAQGLPYDFHDYKKAGVALTDLQHWATLWGWEALINRKGTTWRRLPEAARDCQDADTAFALMMAQPSLIRRPILISGDQCVLGFDPERWLQITRE